MQCQSLNQLGIINSSTDFLDESDISQINIWGGGGDESSNCRDGNRGKGGGVLRDDLLSATELMERILAYLWVQTGTSSSEECFPIIQIYWCRHAFQEFNSFGSSILERLGDGSRVDTYHQLPHNHAWPTYPGREVSQQLQGGNQQERQLR